MRMISPLGCMVFMGIAGLVTAQDALRATGDMWEADPACYLTDEEISAKPII